jgi:isoleucyl-tRNA synthetase
LLANLSDFDPAANALPLDQLTPIDRWILGRAVRVFERCRQAYDEYQFHVVYHRILELCTVDLSQVYLDISKDTMYIEAPDSPLRRSAQTAMDLILRGMVAYIAPIMSFTADEIYEAMPGTKAKSVHVTDFPAYAAIDEDASWEPLFRLREEVTKVLERARAEKQIGQSLEADIVLSTDAQFPKNVDLSKVFIVSHVDVRPASEAGADVVEIEGLGKVGIGMTPARGHKCGRCWNYREEVANDGELCARCTEIVAGLSPGETPTA